VSVALVIQHTKGMRHIATRGLPALPVRYRTRFSRQIEIKLEFCGQLFEKYSNIKFHENPSNGSRGIPCGRTDRRTDTTKLIVAFRNFVNAPKTLVQLIRKIMAMPTLLDGSDNWTFNKVAWKNNWHRA